MATDFDKAAVNYDQTFTHSVIGKLQRGYVYRQLSKIIHEKRPEKILEINCGTGEDAIWLSKQNFNVTATDVSKAMLEVAKNKGNFDELKFVHADINTIASDFKVDQFDLIFSNFGGLNCLSEIQLELFFKNTAALLSEKGRLVLVIMPKNTVWEQLYFLLKADFKNVFRRKKSSLIANVEGTEVITYYYNPATLTRMADYYFTARSVNPIGFFIPPSYLEPWAKKKPRLMSVLDKLESKIQYQKKLSKYADHYLIVFEKR